MSDLSGEIARFENSQDIKCSFLGKGSALGEHILEVVFWAKVK
jgi:hypothetical protein